MNLVFTHDRCGTACPVKTQLLPVSVDVLYGNAYDVPKLRCWYTNQELKLISANGNPVN